MDAIVFNWSIDNFVNRTERLIISPSFTIPDHPQIEWRLKLYPFGNVNGTADFVSLILCKITDRFEVEVEYELAMVGADGQVKLKRITKNAYSEFQYKCKRDQVNLDCNQFVSRNQLANNLLVDGSLTIQVRNVQIIRAVELKNCLDAIVFSWDIDNFLSQKEDLLTSDKFAIPGHPMIKWKLLCYPYGFELNSSRKKILSLGVAKYTNDCDIEIEYQLTVICGDNEEKSETINDNHCFQKDPKCLGDDFAYWSRFISRDQLIHDGYLIDGTLKIQMKVCRFIRAVYSDNYLNMHYNKKQLTLDSFKHYDFRLKTNDQTFDVHKVMLARNSPYFRNMFDSDFRENKENEVDLSQFQPNVIQEVIRFVYTGQLQNFDDLSEQLIFAADYFQMEYLKILCQENMAFRISLDNCLEFLLIADQVNALSLKEAAMQFLNKNKNRIHKQVLRRFFKEHSELAVEWVFWSSS